MHSSRGVRRHPPLTCAAGMDAWMLEMPCSDSRGMRGFSRGQPPWCSETHPLYCLGHSKYFSGWQLCQHEKLTIIQRESEITIIQGLVLRWLAPYRRHVNFESELRGTLMCDAPRSSRCRLACSWECPLSGHCPYRRDSGTFGPKSGLSRRNRDTWHVCYRYQKPIGVTYPLIPCEWIDMDDNKWLIWFSLIHVKYIW